VTGRKVTETVSNGDPLRNDPVKGRNLSNNYQVRDRIHLKGKGLRRREGRGRAVVHLRVALASEGRTFSQRHCAEEWKKHRHVLGRPPEPAMWTRKLAVLNYAENRRGVSFIDNPMKPEGKTKNK